MTAFSCHFIMIMPIHRRVIGFPDNEDEAKYFRHGLCTVCSYITWNTPLTGGLDGKQWLAILEVYSHHRYCYGGKTLEPACQPRHQPLLFTTVTTALHGTNEQRHLTQGVSFPWAPLHGSSYELSFTSLFSWQAGGILVNPVRIVCQYIELCFGLSPLCLWIMDSCSDSLMVLVLCFVMVMIQLRSAVNMKKKRNVECFLLLVCCYFHLTSYWRKMEVRATLAVAASFFLFFFCSTSSSLAIHHFSFVWFIVAVRQGVPTNTGHQLRLVGDVPETELSMSNLLFIVFYWLSMHLLQDIYNSRGRGGNQNDKCICSSLYTLCSLYILLPFFLFLNEWQKIITNRNQAIKGEDGHAKMQWYVKARAKLLL